MKLIQTFSTPIWIDDLSLDIVNIINVVKNIQTYDSGRIISNVGGWQSNDLDIRIINQNKHLSDLFDQIDKTIKTIGIEIDDSLELGITNMWFNVNKKEDYNNPHYHPNSTFSGVVYFQCNETSNIIFEHDSIKSHYPIKTSSNLFSNTLQLYPKAGRIIVFPSWLKHSVQPNKNDSERISMSFNVRQKGI